MPTLNFPTNPTLNQLYSFGGKTWIWTGQAWRLDPQGAINGIVIGNTAPAAASFTSLNAASANIGGNTAITGNLSSANLNTGSISLSGNVVSPLRVQGNITGTNVSTGGTVSAVDGIFNGNVIAINYTGNGRNLTGIVASTGNSIDFGTSNVRIPDDAGNVIVAVDGVANVATFTTTGLQVPGNIVAGNIIGNVTGNLAVSGNNTNVLFNANGVVGASNAFSFDSNTNIVSASGNVIANAFVGNGRALSSVVSDRGTDSNNWNTLTEMGVYTVNRMSWSGTVGTPLDSQVFVGLLEVLNSNGAALTQIFYPGTVEAGNENIQWNRTYWAGSWSGWIKIVNEGQVVTGGEF